MKGRQKRHLYAPKKWQMHPISVTVNHIEIGGAGNNIFQQNCVGACWIAMRSTQTKRARYDWHELRLSN